MRQNKAVANTLFGCVVVLACIGVFGLGRSAIAEPVQTKEEEALQRKLEQRLQSLEATAFKRVGTGYELTLNGARVMISSAGDVRIESAASVTVRGGTAVNVDAGTNASIRSGMATSIRSGVATNLEAGSALQLKGATVSVDAAATASIKGGMVTLNTGGKPIARVGDPVTITGHTTTGATVVGQGTITAGSTTVLAQ